MAAPMKTCRSLFLLGKYSTIRLRGITRGIHAGRSLACAKAEKWDLYSAVCLERPAVVTAALNKIEQEYSEMLQKMELEQSVLSDHELHHQDDLIIAERRKAEDYEDNESEATRVTALELEDTWEAELANFTPADRTTAADKSGDKSTHQRQLDRKLTLLVKQELGGNCPWVLPQGPRHEGETMREAAERVLAEKCGGNIAATFLGNAPVGFYKYKYPESTAKGGSVGAKVFFFKALLKKGQADKASEDIKDIAWVTRDELATQVYPQYRDRLTKFIVEF